MAERAVIVDFGSGNLRSVEKALERAARSEGLPVRFDVTDDPALIAAADRVILPGVGAYAACMAGLRAIDGAVEAIEHAVLIKARPFLGICVGMQILSERGLEFGGAQGLGWIPGEVRPLSKTPHRRIPHMGWNTVSFTSAHPVFGASKADDFYFLHSFHFDIENAIHGVGVCHYEGDFVAAVARDNILGVQFHPEKSQDAGVRLLGQFLKWRP